KILAAAQQVDEHFAGTMSIAAHQATIHLGLAATPVGRGPDAVPSERPQRENPQQTPPRLRIGGNVQAANLISKVTPPYPPDAQPARVQAVVRFTAFMGKVGPIEKLDLVAGPPFLVPAATDAVKQWIYRPTLLNGNPVEVVTQIDVNFTLAQ